MRTDDLIADLSAGLRPVRRGSLERVLMLGLTAGTGAAGLMMLLWLGLRPDLAAAVAAPTFWMKFAYTAGLALVGIALAERAGRPGAPVLPTAGLIVCVAGVMGAVGAIQTMHAPPSLRPALFFGGSYAVCPWLIVAVSSPVLIGVVLSLRRWAPTRPAVAGAAAGLLAGAAGATVYGFHCTESSALFVAVWYTLGIAVTAAVGAACGRFALRW